MICWNFAHSVKYLPNEVQTFANYLIIPRRWPKISKFGQNDKSDHTEFSETWNLARKTIDISSDPGVAVRAGCTGRHVAKVGRAVALHMLQLASVGGGTRLRSKIVEMQWSFTWGPFRLTANRRLRPKATLLYLWNYKRIKTVQEGQNQIWLTIGQIWHFIPCFWRAP